MMPAQHGEKSRLSVTELMTWQAPAPSLYPHYWSNCATPVAYLARGV